MLDSYEPYDVRRYPTSFGIPVRSRPAARA